MDGPEWGLQSRCNELRGGSNLLQRSWPGQQQQKLRAEGKTSPKQVLAEKAPTERTNIGPFGASVLSRFVQQTWEEKQAAYERRKYMTGGNPFDSGKKIYI